MRPLSVPELLNVWERGLALRPFERALAILSAASPESSAAALARWSIGRRDASLLRLREWAFGSELAVLAECPRCHQPLEMAVPVAGLLAPADGASDPDVSVTFEEYELRCRPPNSEDLAACAGLDAMMSRRTLLSRCVVEARHRGKAVAPDELPGEVAAKAVERIAEADPQADFRVALACPDCDYRWDEPFDIVTFFWTEVDAWARRTLRDVHVLAAAYGWRESDILALSPTRRQVYLAMAQT